MIQIKKTILTLVALLAVTTGAWAQTGENIFQYCYDCQRNPAYPTATASASLSDFVNPFVGYKGSGFEAGNTSDGPWKLEYVGLWSTTDQHGIEDFRVTNYQHIYNCTDVPVFRLYQWNATANEYQHASYGVVCAYAKVSNAVEHTAFFEAADGWGCVLTNSSHSSSMNITFDEDLTTGLTTLIAAAAPASSGTPVDDFAWNGATKTGTFTMPGGNVELEPEYYPQATVTTGGVTAATGVQATTDAELVTIDKSKFTGASGLKYFVGTTDAAPAYTATGWTDKVPTAADITTPGPIYVWYYPVGADGDTDDATFSDGDINATALQVTINPAPTYAVTFADGTPETNKWTASPNTGVSKGTTITVTYTGSKKIIGVKVEKKAAAKTLAEATSEDIGKIAGKDGKIYATKADAEAVATGNAVAMIAYVGTASDCAHGLAIALADESAMNWGNAGTACSGKAAVTGGTWRLPSDKDWQYMFIGCGSSGSYSTPTKAMSKSYSGLASKLTTAQGAALQSDFYWSSTKDEPNGAWGVVFDGSNATFYMEDKTVDHKVCACLAF